MADFSDLLHEYAVDSACEIRFFGTAAERITYSEVTKCLYNGGHCGEEFKQIRETELLGYLKQGWLIVHRLTNGEVIVKR